MAADDALIQAMQCGVRAVDGYAATNLYIFTVELESADCVSCAMFVLICEILMTSVILVPLLHFMFTLIKGKQKTHKLSTLCAISMPQQVLIMY